MLYHFWMILGIWSYHIIKTWPHGPTMFIIASMNPLLDRHQCWRRHTLIFFQGTLGFHMVMKKCMAMSLEGRWYWTWKAHFFFFPCRSLAISVWPTDWTPATGWHAQNSHGAIVMIPFHKLKKLVEHSSRGYDEILLVQHGPHHHCHPHSLWVTIEISTLS